MKKDFLYRYGPWALVAGASEGLGLAFADLCASRGLNVVLCARRADKLESAQKELMRKWGVEVRSYSLDFAAPASVDFLAQLSEELEIGLLVYNAALSPIGPFLDLDRKELGDVLSVNNLSPLLLTRIFAEAMAKRGRGGILLMSSLAGLRGSAGLAAYAATKAFLVSLGESLWYELKPKGVAVLTCVGGAIATPGFLRSAGYDPAKLDRPSELKLQAHVSLPEDVAAAALDALGRGPRVVPGLVSKIGALVMERVLSTKASIKLLSSASGGLKEKKE